MLRLQVVVVRFLPNFFCEPTGTTAAAVTWPSSSGRAHACAVADETGGDRVQAQRKQAWGRSLRWHLQLLSAGLRHVRHPLRPPDFHPVRCGCVRYALPTSTPTPPPLAAAARGDAVNRRWPCLGLVWALHWDGLFWTLKTGRKIMDPFVFQSKNIISH
jgi:fermentation-respiration switch protein FrsA (DUF1100 family)